MKFLSIGLLSLVGVVSAQSGAFGQCGGQGWTGATTCVSGFVCTFQNDFFSQCVPGTAPPVTTSAPAKPGTTPAKTSTAPVVVPSGTISKVTGLDFTIDGVTKYFAGTNCYWIGFLTNNADVDLVMSHLQSSGLKILRVWGFNDVNTVPGTGTVYFQFHSNGKSTINTGEFGLQRLDYVVQSAAAHGIKLIINFVNNWTDFGGMQAYINAYGGVITDWYTSAPIQAAYQAYIKAVVSRYINSPAVFAWELANEPRCHGCDPTIIFNWVKTTSAFIKSLDSKHMVIIGDEGMGLVTGNDGSYPYTTTEGVNFTMNIGISTIDFGTLHLYPDSWGVSDDWGNTWIQNHALACKQAGKPCLLEEYGVTSNHCAVESPWQNTALHSSGMAADMFWQFGDTISTGQSSNDGNTIYFDSSDWTCLVTDHIEAIG